MDTASPITPVVLDAVECRLVAKALDTLYHHRVEALRIAYEVSLEHSTRPPHRSNFGLEQFVVVQHEICTWKQPCIPEAHRTLAVRALRALHRHRLTAFNVAEDTYELNGAGSPLRENYGMEEVSQLLRKLGSIE